MVATSQPLAAAAGLRVLRDGGNAIDAAITMAAVLHVVEPMMCGIGGDLFALVYEAESGQLHGLNATGRAGSLVSADKLRSQGLERMPGSGIQAVTVPGALDGWEQLRSRFGSRPLAELLEPAIHYAEEGFPVSEIIATQWQGREQYLSCHADAADNYLMDGRAPRPGEIFRSPDLAKTLRQIAAEGPDAFYKGELARRKLIDPDRVMREIEPGITDQTETVYLTVVDEDRNVVSLIYSIFSLFGSGRVVPGTGIMLQNRGAGFSLEAGHPNEVAPGKRALHTNMPGMVFKNGKPWLSYGVMGGDMQPQGHTQVLANLIDFGMNVQAPGEMPRFRHFDSGVGFESGIDIDVLQALIQKGHRPTTRMDSYGGYQAIMIDPETGVLSGGSDVRKDGAAMGY